MGIFVAVATRSRKWDGIFSERSNAVDGGEITAILALAEPGDVITFSGGFPDPSTFPIDVLGDIAAHLVRQDAAVALQYAPTQGLPGLRNYLADRLQMIEGSRPEPGQLLVTSGGIDGMELLAKSVVDAGDVVVIEAPSYLGAVMAFQGYQADLRGVPMDGEGIRTDILADMLAAGLRPKLAYVIPDYQNPTGLAMSELRRAELVELADRYDFLVLEDVAYRELGFDGERLPSLWSMAPDLVVQLGTFSKTFFPGVRLGWAAGPAEVIARMTVAKQNSDQCSGALGQRLLEEYARAGHLDKQIVASRALYARRAELVLRALEANMPAATSWTVPRGGFFTWVTLPAGVDAVQMRQAATEGGIAYVPGRPFYIDHRGDNQIRLSYSRVSDLRIDEGIARLGRIVAAEASRR